MTKTGAAILPRLFFGSSLQRTKPSSLPVRENVGFKLRTRRAGKHPAPKSQKVAIEDASLFELRQNDGPACTLLRMGMTLMADGAAQVTPFAVRMCCSPDHLRAGTPARYRAPSKPIQASGLDEGFDCRTFRQAYRNCKKSSFSSCSSPRILYNKYRDRLIFAVKQVGEGNR